MAMEALRSLWLSSSAPAVEPRAEARTQPKVSAPERSVDRNILLLPNRSHGDAAGIVGLLGYGEECSSIASSQVMAIAALKELLARGLIQNDSRLPPRTSRSLRARLRVQETGCTGLGKPCQI